ncbi:hypothetical protein CHARACLAT_008443 [Characodon lateralis]|uniref:Delta-like protein n=1 Tax=Characodon lateralis TaxID=208331 RepID=A0ABU7CZ11_9TELE|nr:hypothetical protein [Characodon lateralis]
MAHLFLPWLLLAVSAQTVVTQPPTKAVFELKVHSFNSSRIICRQSQDCRIFFRMCLKHSQSVINPEPPCTYGNASTDALSADPSSISESAPMKVNVSFKWPGSFSLILEAWITDSSGLKSTGDQNNLLSRVASLHRQTVGDQWSQHVHQGNQSKLGFSYRVVCIENYHGEDCSAYCRPRNDTFGHFHCDSKGSRHCLEGWSGQYCTDPICAGGCGEDRGICESPGKCKCHEGWEGKHCDMCKRHPGCLHGTCQQPWQCNCKEGWGGLYCNQGGFDHGAGWPVRLTCTVTPPPPAAGGFLQSFSRKMVQVLPYEESAQSKHDVWVDFYEEHRTEQQVQTDHTMSAFIP